jgi:hypothetical protein
MLETDGSEPRSSQTEYIGSPSCSGFQENSIACYVEYDTSTNYPRQERSSNHAGAKHSGRFAASYLRWDGHSLPRTVRLLLFDVSVISILYKWVPFLPS